VVPLYIKGSLFISFDFKSIPKYIVPSLVLAQNHHPPACSSSPTFPVFQVVQCRLCMCPPLCGDTASPHQAKAAAVLRGSRAALCAFRFPFVTAVIFRCPRGPYNRHLLEASWIAKAIYLRAVFHRRESSPHHPLLQTQSPPSWSSYHAGSLLSGSGCGLFLCTVSFFRFSPFRPLPLPPPPTMSGLTAA
jgi:hypothetical protein